MKRSYCTQVAAPLIIPPDDDPFWYTTLNLESGDDARYRRIEDVVQVELKEMGTA